MYMFKCILNSECQHGLNIDYTAAGMMLIQMFFDDTQVFAVRPPDKVKGIAQHRDRANRSVDANIGSHTGKLPF